MSVWHDVWDAHFTYSHHVYPHITYYREVVGNLLGFASAVGGLRRKVWAWPVGIPGNLLLFTVFVTGGGHGAPLYGQAGRQVFFLLVAVYGWKRWLDNRRASGGDAPAVHPRWATGRERTAYVVLWLAGTAVLWQVFAALGSTYDEVWWEFLCDAWVFVGSIGATYAMARGWVDFWLLWIAVDAVGVPQLLHAELYPSAALFVVYGVFVVYGFVGWRRIARRERLDLGDALLTTEAVA